MTKKQRKYDMEYKIQAVKLAKELGGAKGGADKKLDSLKAPKGTESACIHKTKLMSL